MSIDISEFYRATNPNRTLFANSDSVKEDKKYYVDFSSVRGGSVTENLKKTITTLSPDEPTCQLFTGHIGCGKSTELLKLKAELENEGFHVVYFDCESSEHLKMSDVDLSDILLAITRRVSQSLEENSIISKNQYFKNLFIDIIVHMQANNHHNYNLRKILEPRTSTILNAINSEILEPSIKQLRKIGKKGLVVIVDSLEKIHNVLKEPKRPKESQRPQQEYIFVDRGLQLRSLNCHIVYTMPLALRFSNEYSYLLQRFETPQVLPMVQIELRDGKDFDEGIMLLHHIVLARAFPQFTKESYLDYMDKVEEIFDSLETLNRLCSISGGHIRNLLKLLHKAALYEEGLPISRKSLEKAIENYSRERSSLVQQREEDEWGLLRQINQTKNVVGKKQYQMVTIHPLVYEYHDNKGYWFDVEPSLQETEELKPERNQVFICYSDEDKKWLKKIKTMLKPLNLKLWDSTCIPPGKNKKEEIQQALDTAKVGVLMVSPDFLASESINKHELPYILKATEEGRLILLWICLSDCLYGETKIMEYQPAHDISKPLNSLTEPQLNSTLKNISKIIREALNESL